MCYTYNNINYEEYDKKVQQIHDEQVELTNRIANLETKLMDDINYTPSIFEVEVIDREMKDLKDSLIQKEDDIKKAGIDINKFIFCLSKK